MPTLTEVTATRRAVRRRAEYESDEYVISATAEIDRAEDPGEAVEELEIMLEDHVRRWAKDGHPAPEESEPEPEGVSVRVAFGGGHLDDEAFGACQGVAQNYDLTWDPDESAHTGRVPVDQVDDLRADLQEHDPDATVEVLTASGEEE